jgi:DNA polymerase III delta prime subunit
MPKKQFKQQLDSSLRSDVENELFDTLRHRIVGQEAAISALVDAYIIYQSGLSDPSHPISNLIFLGPTGSGKCLARNTPVLMFNGTIKRVEDILVGDLLMGPDSTPRRVLSLAHGWDEMYNVIPKRGDSYQVNKPHILSLTMTPLGKRYRNRMVTGYPKSSKDNSIVNMSVEDYLSKSKTFKHCAKGYRVGVEFEEQQLPIAPYFLGLWLGNGTSGRAQITNNDKETIETVYAIVDWAGMTVTPHSANNIKAKQWDITPGPSSQKGKGRYRNKVINILRALGVIQNKHIPLIYKANSRKKRLELLAGLIDSDGSKSGTNGVDYSSKVKVLADDVAFLARSLGFSAHVKPTYKKCQTGNGGICYRVGISGDSSVIPVRLKRKAGLERRQKKNVLRTGISVIPAGRGEYFGFTLDGDGLFLLGDFTVTHNTLSLEIMAEALFGTTKALRKVNCAEFQHSHEISKLIGSPPGYLGHKDTTPYFTQENLDKFHTSDNQLTLLLFDEFEKSDDSLWNLLLGILDKASVTLGSGMTTTFEKCIIAMTGNLGAREMQFLLNGGMGFSGSAVKTEKELEKGTEKTALEAAHKKFNPEFLNRIDEIVVFHPLGKAQLRQVVDIELEQMQARIMRMKNPWQFVLDYTPAARAFILEKGTDIKNGARPLRRAIDKHITMRLARLLNTRQIAMGDLVMVDVDKEDKLKFTRVAEGVLVKEEAKEGAA